VNLQTVEIRALVPARDVGLSRRFDQALGFEIPWHDDDPACVRLGDGSFLLQRLRVEAHSAHVVMHLLVENADDWHADVTALDLPARFGGCVGDLKDQPWLMCEFPVWDPTGVLWLLAHKLSKPELS
jgi:hypothetical protein